MKGLSNFMPQDDPNTQLFKLQAEVTDLKKKENDLYARLGKSRRHKILPGVRRSNESAFLMPNCGQQNPPGTRFCGGCGTKL